MDPIGLYAYILHVEQNFVLTLVTLIKLNLYKYRNKKRLIQGHWGNRIIASVPLNNTERNAYIDLHQYTANQIANRVHNVYSDRWAPWCLKWDSQDHANDLWLF